MGDFEIGAVDIAIVALYVILSRIVVFWLTRGSAKNAESFFLGGRSLTWPIVGLSLYATNMGASVFVAFAAASYIGGIAAYSYEWMATIVLIGFIFFLLPLYLRSKVYTMPEYLEKRYDRRSRYLFALITLFMIVVGLSMVIYVSALIVQILFPAIDLYTASAIMVVISALLSFSGGLRAVAYSDAIQAVVLIVGGIIVAYAAIAELPSWELVQERRPESFFHLGQPADSENIPWPGLFSGAVLLGIYFWCADQTMVQRVLAAKDLNHGRWGAIFAGALKLPNLLLIILPGIIAVGLYPDLANPDLVYPKLAFELLPVGLRGVILAALLAATTSTIDSMLGAISTLFAMDVMRPLRPNSSERALVSYGRSAVIVMTILSILVAPQIANFESLLDYYQSILSFVAPTVVAVFLVGIFSRWATADAAFIVLLFSIGIGIGGFVTIEVMSLIELHFLYAAALIFAASVALLRVVSYFSEMPRDAQLDGLIWTPQLLRAESQSLASQPLWKNYRLQSALLLGVTISGVVILW